MTQIPVVVIEFQEGGKAIWVHNKEGSTVLRIQCSGKIELHAGWTNICAHADINVPGNIDICVPGKKRKRKPLNLK